MAPYAYVKQDLGPKHSFLSNRVPKFLLFVGGFMGIFYTLVLVLWFQISNPYLFAFLVLSQAFFLWQALSFIHTIWETEYLAPTDPSFLPPVDIFITVAGEPVEIVEETLKAAMSLDYPLYYVYILNDGFVAKKDNWQDIEELAAKYGAGCFTRKIPGGAKAGNINNALRQTSSGFIAIFDADHVPHRDFLRKTIGQFADPKMGFVQSPQYYKNFDTNLITYSSWRQQSLFFGAICKGKNRLNAVTMCGTNMVIRREPLLAVGGMCDTNIAEDFVTGLLIHRNGWKSAYVPEVLAEGLAPEDFLSYYKQQLRWARGSLEVLFKYNPIFMRGLSWSQTIQYLASASYYLSGIFILINISIPLIFFYFGIVPFLVSTMALAVVFLPYIFLTLYIVQLSSNFTYTFGALAFSMSSWTINLRALFELLIGKKSGFSITSKTAVKGNFTRLAAPHIAYTTIAGIGIVWAGIHYGFTASVATNTAWTLLNCSIFFPFIKASTPSGADTIEKAPRAAAERKPHVSLTTPAYALGNKNVRP